MVFDLQIPPDQATVGQCSVFKSVSVAAAVDLRRSGRFAEAAQLAQCTLQLHPEDADAWFELGAAKSALDARGEASSAWLRALDLAPSNDDARLGLANLAWRDGDLPAANRWLSSVSPQRQQDSEALRLKSALDRAGQPAAFWRFDAGVARSTLSGGLPDWTEARLSLFRRQDATGIGLAIEQARRFDREDLYVELQASHQTGAVIWSLAVGGATNADFRPEQSVRAGAEHYGKGWYVAGEAAHAEYTAGPVEKLGIRGARDVGAGVRLQASAVAVRDENGEDRFGYGLGAVWQTAPRFALEANWSDAPESSDGMTVDVRSLVVGATLEPSPELRFRAGVTHEMRQAYDRTEVSIGLARTF